MTTSPFEVISDEIDIITRETVGQGSDSEESDIAENIEHDRREELDVAERVVLGKKDPEVLKTILFGIPSPTSLLWTLITGGINFLLILMTIDMVYRAPLLYEAHTLSFARLGYISPTSANLVVREPDPNQLPIFVYYRYAGPPHPISSTTDSSWRHVQQLTSFSNATDYTLPVTIRNLRPDTRYQFALSNNRSGFFTTPPEAGSSPQANNGIFTILTTSCIKARTPYSPFAHPLSIHGLNYLSTLLPSLHAQFMLFLGDFIYIDVPHRFGSDIETYRSDYRRVYASPDWPAAAAELSWLHVIDDHEIANDWDGNTTGVYPAAAEPWLHYHVAGNPPAVAHGETFFAFEQGPVSVFMLDTRRYRTVETENATDPGKSMLGEKQRAELLRWIEKPSPTGVRWKIVASSVPFTKNWRFGSADTWGGYLVERRVLLEAMWKSGREQGVGFVVVSGDRHEFAATRLKDESGAGVDVMEFSVSPLNMFYLPTRTYEQRDAEDEAIK